MLFRKTFRNALATLLGMALALAGGAAHAAINLDERVAENVGTVAFAAETLLGNTAVDKGGVTYYRIITGQAALTVTGTLGVPGADNRQVYIRYDFENMVVHSTALATGWADIGDTTPVASPGTDTQAVLSLELGGNALDDYAIFSALDNTVIERQAIVTAIANNRMAIRADAPARIRMTVYFSLEAAIAAENPLTDKSQTVAVVVPALRTRVVPGLGVVATVRSGFTQFSAPGRNLIGALSIGVGGGATADFLAASDGAVVDTLAEVAEVSGPGTTGSLVTYRGDFGVGQFTSSTSAAGSCGTLSTDALTTERNNVLLEQVSVPAAVGATQLCVGVSAANKEEIPTGNYTVAVDYRPISNAALGPADLKETFIGLIRRDGTRVQIPYLTTYDGYVQRVILVNHNTSAVTYAFSFTPEDGVTVTPGEDARGSVPANGTLVLRASDIVSISGKTRTAATLDVVAPDGSVDVATTQLNRDDGGTDTVVYDTERS